MTGDRQDSGASAFPRLAVIERASACNMGQSQEVNRLLLFQIRKVGGEGMIVEDARKGSGWFNKL